MSDGDNVTSAISPFDVDIEGMEKRSLSIDLNVVNINFFVCNLHRLVGTFF